jgi:hypothetical protein
MDDQDAEIIDRAVSGKDVSRREILGAGGAAYGFRHFDTLISWVIDPSVAPSLPHLALLRPRQMS